MENIAICRACNANWQEGRYSDGCNTCGGGAMERPCPLCLGLCGAYWSRALLDSNDASLAHWRGDCAFPGQLDGIVRYADAGVRATWWLDDAARPSHIWACLITATDGRSVILDTDGRDHAFARYDLAYAWLREDDYECLTDLRFDRQVAPDTRPSATMIGQAADLLRKSWPETAP